MSQTKILQIVDNLVKQAENADTLDGKHASEFAAASDVETLKTQVGDASVSEQINTAVKDKANTSDLTAHTGNSTVHITSAERTAWNAKADAEHAHDYISTSQKGVSGGVAELDSTGKVPSSQLPSDVKVAYDHSQETHARTDATKTEKSNTNGNIKINDTETVVYTHPGSGTNPHGTTKSDVGLGNVGNFKAVSTVASQGLTDTEKSNARANIGAQAAGSYAPASHTSDTTVHITAAERTKWNTATTTASNVSSLVGDTAVSTQISNHNSSSASHNDIRELITGLTTRLNTLADSDDTTLDQLSEIVTYIKSNRTLIEEVTTNKVNVSDIINNLTTNVSNKPLSAAQGVAIKSLIDNLQTAVNAKASSSDLSSHTGSTTVHITSTERTNWNAAKTHADSAHAPSNAEVNQNAFSNIAIGSTTIAADSKTDTLTLAGSNVTLTPDATNDKVTIGITQANVKSALGYTPANETTVSNLSTLVGDAAVSEQISDAIANKSDVGHTHNYAGSASAGGSATSAVKLDSSAGSTTQPIYFKNGKPVATSYSLGKSVPSDAVFTDTKVTAVGNHYTPSGGTTTSASGGTLTDITNSSSGVQVVTGVTKDAAGHVTGVTSVALKSMNTNTDTKVTQTVTTTNAAYPLLLAPSGQTATATTTSYFDSGVTLNPSTNTIAANISGSSATATKATQDASGNVIASTYATKSELNSVSNLVGDTAVSTQITNAIASKSDTGHTHDDRYYTETEIDNKLSGKSDTSHTHSSYVNQNAFSNVKVGSSTIAADSVTDTLTLTAGSNITLTADTSGDSVTIAAKDTTYSEATTSAAGLMSKDDKAKLNGIATGANKTVVDTALSSTSTNPVQNKVVNTAISNLNTLVGDTSVSAQINAATSDKAKTDLTNIDNATFKSKVEASGFSSGTKVQILTWEATD